MGAVLLARLRWLVATVAAVVLTLGVLAPRADAANVRKYDVDIAVQTYSSSTPEPGVSAGSHHHLELAFACPPNRACSATFSDGDLDELTPGIEALIGNSQFVTPCVAAGPPDCEDASTPDDQRNGSALPLELSGNTYRAELTRAEDIYDFGVCDVTRRTEVTPLGNEVQGAYGYKQSCADPAGNVTFEATFAGTLLGGGDAPPTSAPSQTTTTGVVAGTDTQASGDDSPPPSKELTNAIARAAHKADRSPLVAALRTPKQISTEAGLILTNIALAAGIALLVFPAVLFNSTLEDNYDRIVGRFRRRDGERSASTRWLLFAAVAIATALLAALLDPKISLDQATALLVLGVAAATVITTVIGHASKRAYLRDVRGRIKAYPVGLIIGAATVGVSRLVGFLPGYLYGIVGGFDSEPKPDEARAGRAAAVGELVAIAIALGAWFAWQPLAESAAKPDPSTAVLVADGLLGAIAALSFQGLLFSMLPLRSLPGEAIWKWSKAAWAGFMTIGAFSFLHVLAHPTDDFTGSTTTLFALFGAFGVFSVGFWAYFRYRRVPT